MPYDMHRIFCATPFELEDERNAFHAAIADFNSSEAMSRGVLFVTVSLVPAMADKRPFQAAVNENIRSSRYYVQILEESWGPPQRNMERDYALAAQLAADSGSKLRETVVLFKKPLLPHRVEPDLMEMKRAMGAVEFTSVEELKMRLRELLSKWLESIAPAYESAEAAQ
jgi:hypothetical protein